MSDNDEIKFTAKTSSSSPTNNGDDDVGSNNTSQQQTQQQPQQPKRRVLCFENEYKVHSDYGRLFDKWKQANKYNKPYVAHRTAASGNVFDEEKALPEGYRWVPNSKWIPMIQDDTDSEGFRYGLRLHRNDLIEREDKYQLTCRRRTMIRNCERIPESAVVVPELKPIESADHPNWKINPRGCLFDVITASTQQNQNKSNSGVMKLGTAVEAAVRYCHKWTDNSINCPTNLLQESDLVYVLHTWRKSPEYSPAATKLLDLFTFLMRCLISTDGLSDAFLFDLTDTKELSGSISADIAFSAIAERVVKGKISLGDIFSSTIFATTTTRGGGGGGGGGAAAPAASGVHSAESQEGCLRAVSRKLKTSEVEKVCVFPKWVEYAEHVCKINHKPALSVLTCHEYLPSVVQEAWAERAELEKKWRTKHILARDARAALNDALIHRKHKLVTADMVRHWEYIHFGGNGKLEDLVQKLIDQSERARGYNKFFSLAQERSKKDGRSLNVNKFAEQKEVSILGWTVLMIEDQIEHSDVRNFERFIQTEDGHRKWTTVSKLDDNKLKQVTRQAIERGGVGHLSDDPRVLISRLYDAWDYFISPSSPISAALKFVGEGSVVWAQSFHALKKLFEEGIAAHFPHDSPLRHYLARHIEDKLDEHKVSVGAFQQLDQTLLPKLFGAPVRTLTLHAVKAAGLWLDVAKFANLRSFLSASDKLPHNLLLQTIDAQFQSQYLQLDTIRRCMPLDMSMDTDAKLEKLCPALFTGAMQLGEAAFDRLTQALDMRKERLGELEKALKESVSGVETIDHAVVLNDGHVHIQIVCGGEGTIVLDDSHLYISGRADPTGTGGGKKRYFYLKLSRLDDVIHNILHNHNPSDIEREFRDKYRQLRRFVDICIACLNAGMWDIGGFLEQRYPDRLGQYVRDNAALTQFVFTFTSSDLHGTGIPFKSLDEQMLNEASAALLARLDMFHSEIKRIRADSPAAAFLSDHELAFLTQSNKAQSLVSAKKDLLIMRFNWLDVASQRMFDEMESSSSSFAVAQDERLDITGRFQKMRALLATLTALRKNHKTCFGAAEASSLSSSSSLSSPPSASASNTNKHHHVDPNNTNNNRSSSSSSSSQHRRVPPGGLRIVTLDSRPVATPSSAPPAVAPAAAPAAAAAADDDNVDEKKNNSSQQTATKSGSALWSRALLREYAKLERRLPTFYEVALPGHNTASFRTSVDTVVRSSRSGHYPKTAKEKISPLFSIVISDQEAFTRVHDMFSSLVANPSSLRSPLVLFLPRKIFDTLNLKSHPCLEVQHSTSSSDDNSTDDIDAFITRELALQCCCVKTGLPLSGKSRAIREAIAHHSMKHAMSIERTKANRQAASTFPLFVSSGTNLSDIIVFNKELKKSETNATRSSKVLYLEVACAVDDYVVSLLFSLLVFRGYAIGNGNALALESDNLLALEVPMLVYRSCKGFFQYVINNKQQQKENNVGDVDVSKQYDACAEMSQQSFTRWPWLPEVLRLRQPGALVAELTAKAISKCTQFKVARDDDIVTHSRAEQQKLSHMPAAVVTWHPKKDYPIVLQLFKTGVNTAFDEFDPTTPQHGRGKRYVLPKYAKDQNMLWDILYECVGDKNKFEQNDRQRPVLTPTLIMCLVRIDLCYRTNCCPCVIVGETGIGKTFMVRLFCRLKGLRNPSILDVNTGTTAGDIFSFVKEAVADREKTEKQHQQKQQQKQENNDDNDDNEDDNNEDDGTLPENVVFFDEVNTTPAQDTIKGIMIGRKQLRTDAPRFVMDTTTAEVINIPGKWFIIGACNPYKTDATVEKKPIYNVQPVIPQSMRAFCWWAPNPTTEETEHIVACMCKQEQLPERTSRYMAKVIPRIHNYIEDEKNVNAQHVPASLRNVDRARRLAKQLPPFLHAISHAAGGAAAGNANVAAAITMKPTEIDVAIMAVMLTYVVSLPGEDRTKLCTNDGFLKEGKGGHDASLEPLAVLERYSKELWDTVVKHSPMARAALFGRNAAMPSEKDLVPELIQENLLLIHLCVALKTPLVIIGPPGSSKSLSISVHSAAANDNDFIKKFPHLFAPSLLMRQQQQQQQQKDDDDKNDNQEADGDDAGDGEEDDNDNNNNNNNNAGFSGLIPVFYQCSKLSTASGIAKFFELAERVSRGVGDTDDDSERNIRERLAVGRVCVRYMDEMGHGEEAPNRPLKILNGLLNKDGTVAFVGTSNTPVERSLCNRCVLLFREASSVVQHLLGAQHENLATKVATAISKMEHKQSIEGCDVSEFDKLVGCRDIHALCRDKDYGLAQSKEKAEQPRRLALFLRHFSSRYGIINEWDEDAVHVSTKSKKQTMEMLPPHVRGLMELALLEERIIDLKKTPNQRKFNSRRFLLVRCESLADFFALFRMHKFPQDKYVFLSGAMLRPDVNLFSTLMLTVKRAMSDGTLLILHQCEMLHDSLYDVFNQNFHKSAADAAPRARVAFEGKAEMWPVKEGFSIIVVERLHRDVFASHPAAFLSRFEKRQLISGALMSLRPPRCALDDSSSNNNNSNDSNQQQHQQHSVVVGRHPYMFDAIAEGEGMNNLNRAVKMLRSMSSLCESTLADTAAAAVTQQELQKKKLQAAGTTTPTSGDGGASRNVTGDFLIASTQAAMKTLLEDVKSRYLVSILRDFKRLVARSSSSSEQQRNSSASGVGDFFSAWSDSSPSAISAEAAAAGAAAACSPPSLSSSPLQCWLTSSPEIQDVETARQAHSKVVFYDPRQQQSPSSSPRWHGGSSGNDDDTSSGGDSNDSSRVSLDDSYDVKFLTMQDNDATLFYNVYYAFVRGRPLILYLCGLALADSTLVAITHTIATIRQSLSRSTGSTSSDSASILLITPVVDHLVLGSLASDVPTFDFHYTEQFFPSVGFNATEAVLGTFVRVNEVRPREASQISRPETMDEARARVNKYLLEIDSEDSHWINWCFNEELSDYDDQQQQQQQQQGGGGGNNSSFPDGAFRDAIREIRRLTTQKVLASSSIASILDNFNALALATMGGGGGGGGAATRTSSSHQHNRSSSSSSRRVHTKTDILQVVGEFSQRLGVWASRVAFAMIRGYDEFTEDGNNCQVELWKMQLACVDLFAEILVQLGPKEEQEEEEEEEEQEEEDEEEDDITTQNNKDRSKNNIATMSPKKRHEAAVKLLTEHPHRLPRPNQQAGGVLPFFVSLPTTDTDFWTRLKDLVVMIAGRTCDKLYKARIFSNYAFSRARSWVPPLPTVTSSTSASGAAAAAAAAAATGGKKHKPSSDELRRAAIEASCDWIPVTDPNELTLIADSNALGCGEGKERDCAEPTRELLRLLRGIGAQDLANTAARSEEAARLEDKTFAKLVECSRGYSSQQQSQQHAIPTPVMFLVENESAKFKEHGTHRILYSRTCSSASAVSLSTATTTNASLPRRGMVVRDELLQRCVAIWDENAARKVCCLTASPDDAVRFVQHCNIVWQGKEKTRLEAGEKKRRKEDENEKNKWRQNIRVAQKMATQNLQPHYHHHHRPSSYHNTTTNGNTTVLTDSTAATNTDGSSFGSPLHAAYMLVRVWSHGSTASSRIKDALDAIARKPLPSSFLSQDEVVALKMLAEVLEKQSSSSSRKQQQHQQQQQTSSSPTTTTTTTTTQEEQESNDDNNNTGRLGSSIAALSSLIQRANTLAPFDSSSNTATASQGSSSSSSSPASSAAHVFTTSSLPYLTSAARQIIEFIHPHPKCEPMYTVQQLESMTTSDLPPRVLAFVNAVFLTKKRANNNNNTQQPTTMSDIKLLDLIDDILECVRTLYEKVSGAMALALDEFGVERSQLCEQRVFWWNLHADDEHFSSDLLEEIVWVWKGCVRPIVVVHRTGGGGEADDDNDSGNIIIDNTPTDMVNALLVRLHVQEVMFQLPQVVMTKFADPWLGAPRAPAGRSALPNCENDCVDSTAFLRRHVYVVPKIEDVFEQPKR